MVVCIASHQRTLPLGIVLKNLPEHWEKVVVVSEPDDVKALAASRSKLEARGSRLHVHTFPNNPLGAKWQHAVDKARDLDPDLLVITGSDDVLIADEAKLLQALDGYDMAGPRSFLAFDGKQHYQCRYRKHVDMPIGGGRVYRRSLLDKMRWKLFDTGRDRWLDEQGYYGAMRHGARVLCEDVIPGLQVVALKGEWPQKNPLAKYIRGRNLDVIPLPRAPHPITYQF